MSTLRHKVEVLSNFMPLFYVLSKTRLTSSMNRLLSFGIATAIVCLMTACPNGLFNDRNGKFLAQPVNLEAFNSEFDDYNSALPGNRYGNGYLIFSSKRDRKELFNLVAKPFELEYDDKTNLLSAKAGIQHNLDIAKDEPYYQLLVRKANQSCNVLGPVVYSFDRQIINVGETRYDGKFLLLYADDSSGDLQIKFVHNFNDKNTAEGPFEVAWLNSTSDDAYPTFNSDFSKVYFCSNREGNFDIFEADLPNDKTQLLSTLLARAILPVKKNTQLSSPADDKCPHFTASYWNNTLYFTSNRTGGLGGFDIYSAQLTNGTWSQPENMGSRVNTTYDEYRPVTASVYDFNYHLGIFSSNRPQGKGGFDLYMVGFLTSEQTRPK